MSTMPETTSGYVDVEGGQLYYEVTGQGQPLVLIHAGIATLRMWDPQVPAFAARYQVIRYDTRGFGRTRSEEVAFSNRQDLADLLAHLGVARAAVLGCSRGGQIAVDFTLEHPAQVAALIPVAAGLSGYEPDPAAAPPGEVELFNQMEALEEARDFPALAELETQVWVDGPGQPPTRVDPALREQVRTGILDNYRAHSEDPPARPLTPPAAGRLAEIRVPTLVIVGDLDTSDALVMADQLAAGIAGAQHVVIPGVAHLPNLERPAEFTRLVLDFLAGIG